MATIDTMKTDQIKQRSEFKNEKKVRRPPGRPRKKPLKEPMKRNGIAKNALNNEHCMEMIYDGPSILKKMFSFLQSMAVKKMCMIFRENCIHIITSDHMNKSHIKITINCEKINHYYCEKELTVNVHPANMEKIIKILDKNYISVAFTSKKTTSKSVLNIIFKNDMQIDEEREVYLISSATDLPDVSYDDLNYPIKFTLPGKYFKKIVSDISSFSDTLTIEKAGGAPLTFIHKSTNKYIVKCPEKINLVSTISDDDIFSSSVFVGYIKPLSGSHLSDYIKISADSRKNMIFNIKMDASNIQVKDYAITIQVNTSTVGAKINKK
jgi:hypothetical protein